MHISQIDVRNFRNLLNVSVDLSTGLNVLVGPNNIGKTNLFDAVRHALGPTASRSEPIWLEEEDRFRNDKGEVSSKPIQVTLTFSKVDDDDRSQFWEIIDFEPGTPIEDARARLNFEASWDGQKKRFKIARWGGDPLGDRGQVPAEIIEALPLIFLPALRDSEAALSPGNRSILARVLGELSKRDDVDHETQFEEIFTAANTRLEKEPLIKETQKNLRKDMEQMAGADHKPASVRAAPPSFQRILRTLHLILDGARVESISASGLGYSNLLYIATILSHLKKPAERECPILLVEEPEAHLSPQLTVLLADYLSGLAVPQVLVNTHSPTFAAHVKPSQVHILSEQGAGITCTSIHRAGLDKKEERQLQRMLDITRATLYFAKGLILVEGISEALLVPELAKLTGTDLAHHHISVLPICGVSFLTFAKIFTADLAHIPVAIITDSDPEVEKGNDWRTDTPTFGTESDRLEKLRQVFAGNSKVGIYPSQVTLEYDLAAAGTDNPSIMADVWEDTFAGTPGTLNRNMIAAAVDHDDATLRIWRGICRAEHTGSKADFANLLADWIACRRLQSPSQEDANQEKDEAEGSAGDSLANQILEPVSPETELKERRFQVPNYIVDALNHVVSSSDDSHLDS